MCLGSENQYFSYIEDSDTLVNKAKNVSLMITQLSNMNSHFVLKGTPYIKEQYKNEEIEFDLEYKI